MYREPAQQEKGCTSEVKSQIVELDGPGTTNTSKLCNALLNSWVLQLDIYICVVQRYMTREGRKGGGIESGMGTREPHRQYFIANRGDLRL